MSNEKPIGLVGGTFDPVHIGHVCIALECISALDLLGVEFIPAYMPPLKPAAAPQRHRLAMLERALDPHPQLALNEIELKRGGMSYTIDTLAALRADNPQQPFCFIMGADAFAALPAWRRWQELADYAHLVVVDRKRRDNRPWDKRLQEYYAARASLSPADLHACPGGYIHKAAVSLPDISSSQVRSLLNRGEQAENILPPGIYDYIKENNLYQ